VYNERERYAVVPHIKRGNNVNKKEKILVAVTVVMLVILVVCAFYDRTPALMSRTLAYELPEDTKVVDIDKHGFLFYRVAYEAKVEIDPNNPEEILTCFVQAYGDSGRMLTMEEFTTMTDYMYENFYSYTSLHPTPSAGSYIWMQEADTEDGHHVLHFIDIEDEDHAYLYIYYVR